MPRAKSKWDGAKESIVSREVEQALARAGFVQPRSIARLPEAVQKAALDQIAGFYFKTQIAKVGGVDRHVFARMQQQSAGIPDYWIRKIAWRPNLWLGIELKARRSGAKISPEQTLLAANEGIVICQYPAEVLAAIESVTL